MGRRDQVPVSHGGRSVPRWYTPCKGTPRLPSPTGTCRMRTHQLTRRSVPHTSPEP